MSFYITQVLTTFYLINKNKSLTWYYLDGLFSVPSLLFLPTQPKIAYDSVSVNQSRAIKWEFILCAYFSEKWRIAYWTVPI